MTIESVKHVIERFVIHFFSATSLVLIAAVGLRYARQTTGSAWLPASIEHTLFFAALIVFAISTLREAWDVYKGQSRTKAATDYASWLLGTGFGAWGLYRWHHFFFS